MRRKRSRTPGAGAIAGVAAAAGVAGTALWRLARRRRSADDRPAPAPPPAEPGAGPAESAASETVRQQWSCACGQVFVVSGDDRHRVYWLPDAPISSPLMDRSCPNCERELPAAGAAAV
jgi:hypothetical protein